MQIARNRSVRAVAFVSLLLTLTAASIYAAQWWRYDRHAAKIGASVQIDNARCPDDALPVHVKIFNGSSATIENTHIYLSARRPGRSTDVGDQLPIDFDAIVPPAKTLVACFPGRIAGPFQAENLDPRTLQWSVGSIRYDFAR
jgi:hypothetical protein